MDPFDLAPYPEFAHQVAACLARIAREDREAVVGSLRRFRFQVQGEQDGDAIRLGGSGRRSASAGKPARGCDFQFASPISPISRQRADMRIPHLSCSNVTRTSVPRSAGGETHPRYSERTAVAAEHYDYLIEGAASTYRSHFAYITRSIGPMTVAHGVPAMDILDFEADLRARNALAALSNIPGGPARQHGLFEAAERCERQAHRGTLTVSTEHEDVWGGLAAAPDAPGWVVEAALLLQQARVDDYAKAAKSKRRHQHRLVAIADVDLAEAYERLVWADTALGIDAAALPRFEQGRAGRVQTRFVVELPNGLNAHQHRAIVERFCARLECEGWMYVAATHRPDAKNDPRNVHLHIDAYDRPSKWMEGMGTDGKPGPGCWDFEVRTRKRNGKLQYPYRQRKIGVRRGGKEQNRHEVGDAYFQELRAAYVAIANDVASGVAGATRYVTGTYRDHGISQDRLEHLGDKIIGNEKRGLVTDAGSRNARIIFNDRLRHVRDMALKEQLALRREARAMMAKAATAEAERSVLEWRQMKRLAIRKQAQATAAFIIRNMAISRAVTVIGHSKDARRVAAAEAWIAETDEAAGIVKGARKMREAEWATEMVAVMADLQHHDARNAIPGSTPRLVYRPRGHEDLQPVSVKHRDVVRNRLLNWLDDRGDDRAALVFDSGSVALGSAEKRKAIDRLFRLFANDLLVQERLHAILDQRSKQRMAAAQDQAEDASSEQPERSSMVKKAVHAIVAEENEGQRAHTLSEIRLVAEVGMAAADRSAQQALASPADLPRNGSVLPELGLKPPSGVENKPPLKLSNRNTERARRRPIEHQAIRQEPRGLRPIGGLPGLRVLRAIGVDDRSQKAASVLPDVQRTDLRGGGPLHLPVRGPRTGRVKDAANTPASTPPEHPQVGADQEVRLKRSIFEQAQEVAIATRAFSKGPSDKQQSLDEAAGRRLGTTEQGR